MRVSVTVPGYPPVEAGAETDAVFTSLIDGAEDFFTELVRLDPDNRRLHEWELARLSKLRSLRRAARL